MSEEDAEACELCEAEEVFDVVFPSSTETSEVLHPCEEAFDFPTSSIAAQLSSVLGVSSSVATVGRDHFDAVLVGNLLIQRGRVVGLIADQPLG